MATGLLNRYGFSSFREVDPYLPLGRIAQPEDTGQSVCAFLASEAGRPHFGAGYLRRCLAGQETDAGVLLSGVTEERNMRVEGRVALVTGGSRGIGAGNSGVHG